jgi:hypothetical protein
LVEAAKEGSPQVEGLDLVERRKEWPNLLEATSDQPYERKHLGVASDLTFCVSSGSQSAKSWYSAHSTQRMRCFWPWPLSLAAKLDAVMPGQSGNKSRSRRERLLRNTEMLENEEEVRI